MVVPGDRNPDGSETGLMIGLQDLFGQFLMHPGGLGCHFIRQYAVHIGIKGISDVETDSEAADKAHRFGIRDGLFGNRKLRDYNHRFFTALFFRSRIFAALFFRNRFTAA